MCARRRKRRALRRSCRGGALSPATAACGAGTYEGVKISGGGHTTGGGGDCADANATSDCSPELSVINLQRAAKLRHSACGGATFQPPEPALRAHAS